MGAGGFGLRGFGHAFIMGVIGIRIKGKIRRWFLIAPMVGVIMIDTHRSIELFHQYHPHQWVR